MNNIDQMILDYGKAHGFLWADERGVYQVEHHGDVITFKIQDSEYIEVLEWDIEE